MCSPEHKRLRIAGRIARVVADRRRDEDWAARRSNKIMAGLFAEDLSPRTKPHFKLDRRGAYWARTEGGGWQVLGVGLKNAKWAYDMMRDIGMLP